MKSSVVPQKFLSFVELFNNQKYFESHEVLEDHWKETTGEEKLFFQGLIQAAVSLHHKKNGNIKGAEYELIKSEEKLKEFPPTYYGIDLKKFLKELSLFIEANTFEHPHPKIILTIPSK